MIKIFKKLGFKKADEMEAAIYLKSIRLAWLYTVLFLVAWSLYESHQARIFNERVNLIPCGLLVSQNLILILSQLFFRYRMVDGEDESKKNPFMRAILIIGIIVVIIVVLGFMTRSIIW